MAVFIRAKRVTDPLDEKVRARLRGHDDDDRHRLLCSGYTGSGSDHEGASAFSGLLHGFFFHMDKDEDKGSQGWDEEGEIGDGSDVEDADRPSSSSSSLVSSLAVPPEDMIRDLMSTAGDRFRRDLVRDVSEAVERLSSLRSSPPAFRRAVMGSLRESGYNVGICKARWERSKGLTAGSYEYIDVVRSSKKEGKEGKRYILDVVDFAGEFEIARPTEEYEKVVAELPRVYVGGTEDLRRVVRVVADAVKRSLTSRDMHVPPWRKSKYMQVRWLGPYKRTTNTTPASAPPPLPPSRSGRDIQCRAVGFEPDHFIMPTASGTR